MDFYFVQTTVANSQISNAKAPHAGLQNAILNEIQNSGLLLHLIYTDISC